MIYKNITEVSIMWYQDCKRKRTSGVHKTSFNSKKNIDLTEGDMVFIGKNKNDKNCYWIITEVLDKRQSSLSQYNYVSTLCKYVG